MKPKALTVGAVLLVPMLAFALILSIILTFGSTPAAACGPAEKSVDVKNLPQVPGYSADQLSHAAVIINAGKALHMSLKGQAIGVMTAMGESGLQILDKGDSAGPDSRGLFQQRANGAWGSYEDRMNPTTSAANFFKALQKVPGWGTLEPTIAAHKTQANADPYQYEKFWPGAVTLVSALANVKSADIGCLPNTGSSGAGNDYPWATSPINTGNPATHFNFRECVDFAWFRFMQQVGTPNPPYKFDSLAVQPGSALTWKAAWDRQGWPSGHTPKVGAIIWYAPGVGGAGVSGHVAVVKAVNANGTVLEEGYNMLPDADHAYYTRTIQTETASAYLYIPGKD